MSVPGRCLPGRRPVAVGRAVLLLLAVALAAGACGSAGPSVTPVVSSPSAIATVPSDSVGPSDTPGGPVIPDSPVAGIVVAVDSAGLDQVKGFTLRTNDGETIAFTLGALENATDFSPGHLKEHQTTAAPVLVFFRQENGQLVVYRIEDAG